MGTELAFTLFFKGGLYVSLGFEWIMNVLIFQTTPDVQQTGSGDVYFAGQTRSFNHALTSTLNRTFNICNFAFNYFTQLNLII